MVTIIVKYPTVSKTGTKKASNELLWYDAEHKVMRKFTGGRLVYAYKFDSSLNPPRHRLLPKVEDVEEIAIYKGIDKTAVIKWYNQYENYNTTALELVGPASNGFEFEVPSSELEDVLYDLHRKGFEYDV